MADNQLVRTAAEHLSQGTEGSAEFVEQVSGWSDALDAASLVGLLPVAITLMILHEMYFSTTDNRAPRIGWMLLRIIGFGACLAGYDRIVGLLTGLVGGASAWPDPGDLITPLENGLRVNMDLIGLMKVNNLGDTLGPFLIWAMLFMVDCMLALFAVVVVTVLVKIQALLLVIFVASGKTCLILSIMPGVGLGKSWAKAVATVAAWGAMGGVVYSAVGFTGGRFSNFAASSNIQAHFQIWLAYALIGIFFMSIPKLVGALASGSMTAAPGLAAAIGGGLMAAKFMSPSFGGRKSPNAERSGDFSGQPQRRGGKVERGSGEAQSGVPGAARDRHVSPRSGSSEGQRKHQAKSARAMEQSEKAGAHGGYQKTEGRPVKAEHRNQESGQRGAEGGNRGHVGPASGSPGPAKPQDAAGAGERSAEASHPIARRSSASSPGLDASGERSAPLALPSAPSAQGRAEAKGSTRTPESGPALETSRSSHAGGQESEVANSAPGAPGKQAHPNHSEQAPALQAVERTPSSEKRSPSKHRNNENIGDEGRPSSATPRLGGKQERS